MYLPQFHCIPENNKFWGEGFTDWTTVKQAVPLYRGHQQPRIPLNYNYYDLSLAENVVWQSKLAKKYGLSGFGVYHYWFNNEKNLLTKPAEIMRDNSDIDVGYFFIWDNASWKRSWSNVSGNDWAPQIDDSNNDRRGPQILIPYILGKESDWRNHYDYLLSHFKSNNYIKIDNKPIFSIIDYSGKIPEMCSCWNQWAKEDGFDGIFFIFKNSSIVPQDKCRYYYEPHQAGWTNISMIPRLLRNVYRMIKYHSKIFYDYDDVWNNLLRTASSNIDSKVIYGAFAMYDDTPRRGRKKSKVLRGASPLKFEIYFTRLLQIAKNQGRPFVFLTAWNEWGEGAYLEPDVQNGYAYLEAVRNSINKLSETND